MKLANLPRYVALALGLRTDEMLGFRVLARLAKHLVPRYRLTWPELAWFDQIELSRVLERFGERNGFNAHRRLAIQQLLRLTAAVPGDTAECGVYKGCGSYLILHANAQSALPRTHHIFDSFAGLSAPSDRDGEYWARSDLSIEQRVVARNLSEFPGVELHPGWIPDRFPEVADRVFSFVHVDVDLHDPTLDSLRFFYDRMSPGAILICDDYLFLTCPGATEAVDAFLVDKPEKMIALAGGGGFFIKGCVTAGA